MLSAAILPSFIGAKFGVIEPIFFAPALADVAFAFSTAEIRSLMLFGLFQPVIGRQYSQYASAFTAS